MVSAGPATVAHGPSGYLWIGIIGGRQETGSLFAILQQVGRHLNSVLTQENLQFIQWT